MLPGNCQDFPARKCLISAIIFCHILLTFLSDLLVLSDLAGCQLLLLADHVVGGVVDAAAAEHEAVHTHAEVVALSLQTLPDKHAGALQGTVSTAPAHHSLT